MEGEKSLVELFAVLFADVFDHFYACFAQFSHPGTVHLVVIINRPDDHFGNSVSDDGIRAGRRFSEMRAGFKVDIQSAFGQQ